MRIRLSSVLSILLAVFLVACSGLRKEKKSAASNQVKQAIAQWADALQAAASPYSPREAILYSEMANLAGDSDTEAYETPIRGYLIGTNARVMFLPLSKDDGPPVNVPAAAVHPQGTGRVAGPNLRIASSAAKWFHFVPGKGPAAVKAFWAYRTNLTRYPFDHDLTLGEYVVPKHDLNKGYAAFMLYCFACHGEAGDGKGPASAYLRPPPRDFRTGVFKYAKNVQADSLPHDEEIYYIVKNGLAGTAMHPWDISDHDLYQVIEFLKTYSWKWAALPDDDEAAPLPGKLGTRILAVRDCDKAPEGDAQANCKSSDPWRLSNPDLSKYGVHEWAKNQEDLQEKSIEEAEVVGKKAFHKYCTNCHAASATVAEVAAYGEAPKRAGSAFYRSIKKPAKAHSMGDFNARACDPDGSCPYGYVCENRQCQKTCSATADCNGLAIAGAWGCEDRIGSDRDQCEKAVQQDKECKVYQSDCEAACNTEKKKDCRSICFEAATYNDLVRPHKSCFQVARNCISQCRAKASSDPAAGDSCVADKCFGEDPVQKRYICSDSGACEVLAAYKPPNFLIDPIRNGNDAFTTYRTLSSGVYGTAMATFRNANDDAEIWAMAYYLESLSAIRESGKGENALQCLISQGGTLPLGECCVEPCVEPSKSVSDAR